MANVYSVCAHVGCIVWGIDREYPDALLRSKSRFSRPLHALYRRFPTRRIHLFCTTQINDLRRQMSDWFCSRMHNSSIADLPQRMLQSEDKRPTWFIHCQFTRTGNSSDLYHRCICRVVRSGLGIRCIADCVPHLYHFDAGNASLAPYARQRRPSSPIVAKASWKVYYIILYNKQRVSV